VPSLGSYRINKSQQNRKITIVPLSNQGVMDDNGLLGVLSIIFGTILGFSLSKISDIITAKRQKQRYQNLLRFKSNSIKLLINNIKKHVNKTDRITNQQSLTIIEEFLLKNDIKEEISKLESISEKIVKSNYDEKERSYFDILARLKFNINFLLNISTIHTDDPKDEKPLLLNLLNDISNDLDLLSQGK
jgi:hypothetical protein